MSDALFDQNKVLGKYQGEVTREAILELEREILACPQAEIPVSHEFCNGLYARTIRIPAGVVLTGAIHKEESFFIVRSGQILLTTDTGVIHAGPGFMSVTRPGQKRAGLALTECEVVNIMVNQTNETNPDKLWNMYTETQPVLGGV